ncbi:MAG: response regulator, partial [Burkholderiaceae bacterium]
SSPARALSRSWLAAELEGQRALLVDDNPHAIDVLARMLESVGVEVDRASSGAAALEIVARSAPFTWIVVDWKMPGMDGVECARRLIEGRSGDQPSILLITAFGHDNVARAVADLGLDGILQKPVTLSSLYECLLQVRGAPPFKAAPGVRPIVRGGPPIDAGLQRRLAGARVLLAEDHPLNRELACELLSRAGVQVEVVDNGREAIDRLERDPDFDAVLMDCQMPVMDGYAATRALRADPRWQRLPIIAMTASAFADDRERALASGMNAHITKPLDVEVLLRTLGQWVDGARAARPTVAPDAPASTPVAPGEPALDTAAGLARCLGKTALYHRLLRGFREGEADFPARFSAALDEGRWPDALRIAHDLKGLSGTVGAHGLSESLQSLQTHLAENDVDAARAELPQIADELTRVLREIDATLLPEATPDDNPAADSRATG